MLKNKNNPLLEFSRKRKKQWQVKLGEKDSMSHQFESSQPQSKNSLFMALQALKEELLRKARVKQIRK